MKTKTLCVAFSLLAVTAHSQLTPQQKYDQTLELPKLHSRHLVAPYMLDSIIWLYQKALSGYQVKEGKTTGSTATISDKGVTINAGLVERPMGKGTLYFSANVSAAGDDKFSNVFKDGKYQHTISGGGTVNFFLGQGVGTFNCRKKVIVTNGISELVNIKEQYSFSEDKWSVNELQKFIIKSCTEAESYIKLMDVNCDQRHLDKVMETFEKGKSAVDTLEALSLLPEGYIWLKSATKINMLAQLKAKYSGNSGRDLILLETFLSKAENFQLDGHWNAVSMHWVTVKGNYNISPQPIIDLGRPSDQYLKTFNSEYFTGSFSYNYTKVFDNKSQFQYTWSPTVSISTARQFKDENKVKILKLTPYSPGAADTILQRKVESEGFTEVASRKVAWSIEVPYLLFWNKANVGIEVAVRAGDNDLMGDNIGGRIGIFIPVDIKDEVPVWIQPVLKIGKLFNYDNTNFWKDNVAFGFNLSVALKKATLSKK